MNEVHGECTEAINRSEMTCTVELRLSKHKLQLVAEFVSHYRFIFLSSETMNSVFDELGLYEVPF